MATKKIDLISLDTPMSTKSSYFDIPLKEGILNISAKFRESLSISIRQSDLTRYEISARASEYLGVDITKDMLDKYTAGDPRYALKAEHLPGILAAVRSVDPARVLLAPLNHYVIDSSDHDLLKLKTLKRKRDELDAEIRELERKVR